MKVMLIAVLLASTLPGLWLACYLLIRQPPDASGQPQLPGGERREPLSVVIKYVSVRVLGCQVTIPAIVSRFQRFTAVVLLISVVIYWLCSVVLVFHAPAFPRYD